MFNQLYTGHAAAVMADFPAGCIDLIVTSPPYWDAVEYGHGRGPWASYGGYLDDMQTVWVQCARVLRPHGKLCINAALMPVPQGRTKRDPRGLRESRATSSRGS
jgi:DNA modification methylase